MTDHKLITHQIIDPEKLERAKELRQKMTPAEGMLWSRLRRNQLGGYHFRRQQIIGPYIVDFFCNPVRLVIEIDGDVHLAQRDYDRERELELFNLGLRLLRFSNNEVEDNIEAVLVRILKECTTYLV